MAYRWKTQMGPSQSEVASQQMAGYNPHQQRGVPFQTVPGGMQPPPDMTGYGESLQAASDRAGIIQQLNEKQERLAAIESEIAQIDRQYPELKDGGQQWEIAAKRAEIGDMSAYDSMMARGQQAGGQASAIEGELKAAEKLLWGLKSKNTEDREIARNQIEVALRSAEEWQDKTRQPMPESYNRLRAALENSTVEQNASTMAGILWSKMQDNTLTDADRAYAKALHDADPNSADAKTYREIYESTKGKTTEDKAAAKEWAAKISGMVKSIESKSPQEQNKWWNGLSKKEKNGVLKIAKWVSGPNGDYLERKK